MLQYLLKNRIRINAIIDNDSDKIGTFCENIPIIAFSEIDRDAPNIFIAVSLERSADEIMKQIAAKYPKSKVCKMANLLKHPAILKIL